MAPARKRVSETTRTATVKRQRISVNAKSISTQQANTDLIDTKTENESFTEDNVLDPDGDVIICLKKQSDVPVRYWSPRRFFHYQALSFAQFLQTRV
jgi:hypothetical protein